MVEGGEPFHQRRVCPARQQRLFPGWVPGQIFPGETLPRDTDAKPGQSGFCQDNGIIFPGSHLPDPCIDISPEILYGNVRIMAKQLGTPARAGGPNHLYCIQGAIVGKVISW